MCKRWIILAKASSFTVLFLRTKSEPVVVLMSSLIMMFKNQEAMWKNKIATVGVPSKYYKMWDQFWINFTK